jgi:hypothetical protein
LRMELYMGFSLIKWRMARPERFELPTTWFEAGKTRSRAPSGTCSHNDLAVWRGGQKWRFGAVCVPGMCQLTVSLMLHRPQPAFDWAR